MWWMIQYVSHVKVIDFLRKYPLLPLISLPDLLIKSF